MSKYVSAKSLVAAVGFVGLAIAAVPFIGHAAEPMQVSACRPADGGYGLARETDRSVCASGGPAGLFVPASFER